MKKLILVIGLLSTVFLSGCGKESDGDGMACGWFEIDGQMKEICVPDANQ
jgi:hypothetical protein